MGQEITERKESLDDLKRCLRDGFSQATLVIWKLQKKAGGNKSYDLSRLHCLAEDVENCVLKIIKQMEEVPDGEENN